MLISPLSVRAVGDEILRSTRDVTGYYIMVLDGDVGHVEDFLVDDRAWAVCHLVVDTRNRWPGNVLSPEWIETGSWPASQSAEVPGTGGTLTRRAHTERVTGKKVPVYRPGVGKRRFAAAASAAFRGR